MLVVQRNCGRSCQICPFCSKKERPWHQRDVGLRPRAENRLDRDLAEKEAHVLLLAHFDPQETEVLLRPLDPAVGHLANTTRILVGPHQNANRTKIQTFLRFLLQN